MSKYMLLTEKQVEKIRADAIDEFRNRIMDINTTIAFDRYLNGIYDLEELMIEGSREIAEQLKEQKRAIK